MIDDLARLWAEREVRERAERYYPGAKALARVHSDRFLRPLLRRGTVSDIEVALFDVSAGDLRIRRLEISLHQVTVRRRDLWRGRIRLRELGSGTVEAEIDGPSLASAVGLPLVFHDDEVEVRQSVGPLAISARGALTVDETVLRFRPGRVQGVPLPVSLDFELPLPVSPLWPRAADVRSVEGALVVTCDLDDIPPGLIAPPAAATTPEERTAAGGDAAPPYR